MTLFEYLAIAFSLVFSFAATRILSGLSHVADPGRRYWVHLVAASGWLVATIGVFWAFWSYRDVTWTLSRFVLVLASPAFSNERVHHVITLVLIGAMLVGLLLVGARPGALAS